jgi:hypothetical protein
MQYHKEKFVIEFTNQYLQNIVFNVHNQFTNLLSI